MIPMGKFLDRVADIHKAIREFHAGRVSNWIRVLSKWIRVRTGKGWNGASSQEVDWDGLCTGRVKKNRLPWSSVLSTHI